MRIRVFIVDDQPIVRQGYLSLIEREFDLEVCGVAATELDAVEFVRTNRPDVVVVELKLELGNGFDLIRAIGEVAPVLVVSVCNETVFAGRAIASGARGFISKSSDIETLAEGIRAVCAGETVLSERIKRRVLQSYAINRDSAHTFELAALTNRELDVFRLLGEGLSTRAIANKLCLSSNTVYRHRANIRTKLGMFNSLELIHRATEWVLRYK